MEQSIAFDPVKVQQWVNAVEEYEKKVQTGAPFSEAVNAKFAANLLFANLLSSVGVSQADIQKIIGASDNDPIDNV